MHGPILAFLALLFFLRVLGQALVVFFSVDWLPPDKDWASGLVPYPTLLTVQLLMLIGMIRITNDVLRKRGFFARFRPRGSRWLIRMSAVYAAAMAIRYIVTMTLRPEMRWFGGAIPIFFHFVLAAFLYTWGKFQAREPIFARPDHAC